MVNGLNTLYTGGYTLVVIEDEPQVALAGTIPTLGSSTAVFTVCVVAFLTILAVAVFYMMRCRQVQFRIAELTSKNQVPSYHYNRWSYKSLKDEVSRLENEIASKLLF